MTYNKLGGSYYIKRHLIIDLSVTAKLNKKIAMIIELVFEDDANYHF